MFVGSQLGAEFDRRWRNAMYLELIPLFSVSVSTYFGAGSTVHVLHTSWPINTVVVAAAVQYSRTQTLDHRWRTAATISCSLIFGPRTIRISSACVALLLRCLPTRKVLTALLFVSCARKWHRVDTRQKPSGPSANQPKSTHVRKLYRTS